LPQPAAGLDRSQVPGSQVLLGIWPSSQHRRCLKISEQVPASLPQGSLLTLPRGHYLLPLPQRSKVFIPLGKRIRAPEQQPPPPPGPHHQVSFLPHALLPVFPSCSTQGTLAKSPEWVQAPLFLGLPGSLFLPRGPPGIRGIQHFIKTCSNTPPRLSAGPEAPSFLGFLVKWSPCDRSCLMGSATLMFIQLCLLISAGLSEFGPLATGCALLRARGCAVSRRYELWPRAAPVQALRGFRVTFKNENAIWDVTETHSASQLDWRDRGPRRGLGSSLGPAHWPSPAWHRTLPPCHLSG
jgi:hypothetical protein